LKKCLICGMKKTSLLTLLFVLSMPLLAQVKMKEGSGNASAAPGFHEHEKFYLSLGLGAVFGSIRDQVPGLTYTVSGTGSIGDFKIGGSISPSLILHATFLGRVISGPTISIPGFSIKTSEEVQIREDMIGIGLTHYVKSPSAFSNNMFLSASVGLGNYTLNTTNNGASLSFESKAGFAMQLKLGKEWWISRNWGLGIGFDYSKTVVSTKNSTGSETINSDRFGIMLNATFD
jgi:hypothetical protein